MKTTNYRTPYDSFAIVLRKLNVHNISYIQYVMIRDLYWVSLPV